MQVPYRKPGKYAMMKQDPVLTSEKARELAAKLDKLKNHSRPKGAEEVRRLAELGDFSENVEYQLAKGKLRGINQAILTIENQLKNAVIIEPNTQHDTVAVGHTVTIRNEDKAKLRTNSQGESGTGEKKYLILGSTETSPEQGVISHVSPLGAALIGKKVGDTIHIKTTEKQTAYLITKIE
jgi:transcription elongation factor GreA